MPRSAYSTSSHSITLTGLAAALHRMGLPEEALRKVHEAVEQGRYVVILHCSGDEVAQCLTRIRWAGADESHDFAVVV